jgi:hypothetical protein
LVMKTLAILAQKGGSGKTNIAVHMAAWRLGEIFAPLSSTSTQRSAQRWNENRPEGRKIDTIAADVGQLAPPLERAKIGGIQWVA